MTLDLRTPRLLLLVLLTVGSAKSLHAAEEPQITAGLEKTEIFEGQSVSYQVIVDNVENPPTPTVRGGDDFELALAGQQSLDSQQITIINGVMSKVTHRGKEFHYRLTPKRTGTLTIPAAEVTVGGKTLRGNALQLVVEPPTAQDLAIVELKADRTAVYPTQPFTVTVSVFVKGLPAPESKRDPLTVQSELPKLSIPWLAEQDLPNGLSARETPQRWMAEFLTPDKGGVSINNFAQHDPFDVFRRNPPRGFRPAPQEVTRRNPQGDSVKYYRYDFPRTFTAQQSGTIRLAAVTLQGIFAMKGEKPGAIEGKEIYATSLPLTILVKDVPRANRPEDYVGAIGKFNLLAELSPRQAKVGDPLTLTLSLVGSGSLAGVKPPDLSKTPAVAGRFKIYEATKNVEGETAKFVYSLRPLSEGAEPFPPVSVSYFDVDQERYETVQTEPIPLNVAKAETLSSAQIVSTPRTGGSAKDVEARREGIFANITDAAAVRDQSVRPGAWLASLGGCVGAYFLVAAVTVLVQRRAQDKSAVRRRAAAGRARQQLHAAAEQWKQRKVREAADLVQDALAGLVADVAGIDGAGLTAKDVVRQLQSWQIDPPLVARAEKLLATCDAARYGGAAACNGLCDEAGQVVESLLAALRSGRRLR